MKSLTKSVLIWYSAPQMMALVSDVDRYPDFLPWCDHARVIERDTRGMVAEVGIAMGGLRQSFTTRNDHATENRIGMRLVRGPFSKLEGAWTFTPLSLPGGAAPAAAGAMVTAEPAGAAISMACRVELTLSYGFDSAALQAVVGPVFDRIAATLVDAFVKRAEQVYG